MKINVLSLLLLVCCGCSSMKSNRQMRVSYGKWGPSQSGLRCRVLEVKTDTWDPYFMVEIQNVTEKDILLQNELQRGDRTALLAVRLYCSHASIDPREAPYMLPIPYSRTVGPGSTVAYRFDHNLIQAILQLKGNTEYDIKLQAIVFSSSPYSRGWSGKLTSGLFRTRFMKKH